MNSQVQGGKNSMTTTQHTPMYLDTLDAEIALLRKQLADAKMLLSRSMYVAALSGLQAERKGYLRAKTDYAPLLEAAVARPQQVVAYMKANGLKIDNLDDPMQKLALSIYTDLLELASQCEQAIEATKEGAA